MWHLSSLDAPSVAAVWTWFTGYAFGVPIPWTSVLGMFLAVWALYAADRLLDAAGSTRGALLEDRHLFHDRHRRFFLVLITISASVLAALLCRFSLAECRLFMMLGSLLFAYFFVVHVIKAERDRSHPVFTRLPKELAVGVFFPAAVFIPTVARAPHLRVELSLAAALLAAACTLNCLFVYSWEHPTNCSDAHWTTRLGIRNIQPLAILTVVSSWVVAHEAHIGGITSCALATGLSVGGLLSLDRLQDRIERLTLRAAADFVLLSPIFVAAVQGVIHR